MGNGGNIRFIESWASCSPTRIDHDHHNHTGSSLFRERTYSWHFMGTHLRIRSIVNYDRAHFASSKILVIIVVDLLHQHHNNTERDRKGEKHPTPKSEIDSFSSQIAPINSEFWKVIKIPVDSEPSTPPLEDHSTRIYQHRRSSDRKLIFSFVKCSRLLPHYDIWSELMGRAGKKMR